MKQSLFTTTSKHCLYGSFAHEESPTGVLVVRGVPQLCLSRIFMIHCGLKNHALFIVKRCDYVASQGPANRHKCGKDSG
jgi:hypothetical protein